MPNMDDFKASNLFKIKSSLSYKGNINQLSLSNPPPSQKLSTFGRQAINFQNFLAEDQSHGMWDNFLEKFKDSMFTHFYKVIDIISHKKTYRIYKCQNRFDKLMFTVKISF